MRVHHRTPYHVTHPSPQSSPVWKGRGGIKQIAQSQISNRAMRLAAFLEATLMILFSVPERWSRFDLRHNWAIKPAAFLQFFSCSVGGCLLLRGMIKNHRSILRANIGSLPVQRRGVVVGPENIQKFVIADL